MWTFSNHITERIELRKIPKEMILKIVNKEVNILIYESPQDETVDLYFGKVLDGKIPNNKMKLVQAWVELHKDELLADWELAISGEKPYKIEPLK